MGSCGDFMGFYGDLMGFTRIYTLLNVDMTMDRSTMLLIGKLTISMAIFNSNVCLPGGSFGDGYQRIYGSKNQWPFQEPKLEVPDARPMILGNVMGYSPKIWSYMAQ